MQAKDFTLADQHGNTHHLADLRGSYVVLYFYPKDFTPGCTQEACEFRDAQAQMQQLGAVVLGVSKDSVSSHAKFADKHELGFPLLSDSDLAVTKAYGAFGTKNLYGKTVEGVKRTTVLIGPDGSVLRQWDNVKVKGHVEAVLQELRKHADASAGRP